MAYVNVNETAKKLRSDAYVTAITCQSESCPLFHQCAQFAAMGKKYSKKPIKLFFVFDAPQPEDISMSMAAISESGRYFRSNWLDPFIGDIGLSSYLITHLVRSPLLDAKGTSRNATAAESAYCWEHFKTDLFEYRPEVLVVFGAAAFNQLYDKAKNKEKLPDPDTSVGKLRRIKSMVLQFADDYSPTVYVGYSPSYILRSPASLPVFIEDKDRVVNHFCPNKKNLTKQEIKVDKNNITLVKSVKEAVDFIDSLANDLPKDQPLFDLAFDSESENLNRMFNNKFLSWQFSYLPDHATFIPIDHPDNPLFADIKDKVKLIAAMQKLLNSSPEQTNIGWILGHNLKFDLSLLYGLFRILPNGSIPFWDTMLGMHWLDENRKASGAVREGKPYSLKTLGKEIFNFNYKNEALAARADGDLVALKFEDLVEYGGSDTILTWHLKQEQMRLATLQKDNASFKLERFMRHYYSPATRAVSFMECNGLHVSKSQLQYLQGEESPIWNRIDRIENVELQTSPEILAFKEKYKKILKGETNVSYEEDLWGDEATTDSDLIFNPSKKDQETALYLDFLGLEPLGFSKKTNKATLNKEFLAHYAEREVYLALPAIAPYADYYKTPLSHDEDDDEPVFPKNPLQLILELRELSKLGNTYLESIGEMIGDKKGDCIDGRIRASFWLGSTDTGRLSSSSPNLQNLPSGRSKLAKEIKNLFQAEPPSKRFPNGTALIQLDYKTAEVRWAAIFANDKNLIRLFNEARDALLKACDPNCTMSNEEFEATQLASDIHRRTASLMFGVPPKDVSKAMRSASKSITFGLTYGMGTQTLANDNGWSLKEAEEKVEMFFSAFPQLRSWLEANPQKAEQHGYVETIMGRRRRLDFLFNNTFRNKAKASRLAMNAPIQGQSSDAGIIGLCQFLQYLLDNKLEKRWIIQNVVHDSCLLQAPMEDIEKALVTMQYYFVDGMAEYIKKYFNFTLPLPIECEIEVGLKYGDLTKWDGRPTTLPTLIEKLKKSAQELWYVKKEQTGKPTKDMDLVRYKGK